MDERAFIKKLNRGSRSALDQAIERYTPYVSAVILRALAGRACREDVEELCADVFVALWTHAGEIDPDQGVRPWLAAVARNRAIDWLRRQRPAAPIPEDAPDPAPGPEELAQRRERSARLWAAVDALGEPDRTLFVRYYYEEDKLKTIAAELGLSQTAAKQRLFRGRKALRAALKGVETP
ncbi:MAG: sigma-70 family RNA polymerase sigma factor [Oscillospiraceae bacterium]|jgi:RNA polymerase sigma factor (sigma-70 family)|nr:sigma-70 family RNA polymerase sigma factor [Oscillospiraceae bacterium]MCI9547975.1 sigma-70 family RNA polymerase sigma factor [Oscillospiraceae bacterium]